VQTINGSFPWEIYEIVPNEFEFEKISVDDSYDWMMLFALHFVTITIIYLKLRSFGKEVTMSV